jgi:hypothetical protein
MAWTSAHFAVGMAGGGALTLGLSLLFPRAWKLATPIMTIGGIWAIVPDLPRIWREDFPSLPFSSFLGRRELETSLHQYGDVFALHRMLDSQPNEYALHGLAAIVLFYNLAFLRGWLAERIRRRSTRPGRVNVTHVLRSDQPIHGKESSIESGTETPHDPRRHHACPRPCAGVH